jgi:hypothetical protein
MGVPPGTSTVQERNTPDACQSIAIPAWRKLEVIPKPKGDVGS